MMADQFKALVTVKHDGQFSTSLGCRSKAELPAGELLIKVAYSSLNYKDALSASGHPGVSRYFPHTPGIDAAGIVEASSDSAFKVGDAVIVTGFDLGMNTAGGLAEFIRVPSAWVVPLPTGLSLKNAMVLGTAGLTAGLSVEKLLASGLKAPASVLVTGASGGVGSIAVALLSTLGFEVHASTAKLESRDWLQSLGAVNIIDRSEISQASAKPLLKPRWAAAIDTVGGDTLATVLKSVEHGGLVTCCGLTAGDHFDSSVYPFILRGVSLLGIDSVEIPLTAKQRIWQSFAADWALPQSVNEQLFEVVSLEQCVDYLPRFLAGGIRGRVLVEL